MFWLFYLIGLIVFGSLALVVRVLKFLASVSGVRACRTQFR